MISELILISIGISALLTYFTIVNEVPKWLDFKPFNCINCLCFWTVLILSYILQSTIESPMGVDITQLILSVSNAGIAFFLPIILKKIIKY